MDKQNDKLTDDPSSAPESGTVRDETSGNQPAAPNRRPTTAPDDTPGRRATDDPSVAGAER